MVTRYGYTEQNLYPKSAGTIYYIIFITYTLRVQVHSSTVPRFKGSTVPQFHGYTELVPELVQVLYII